MSQVWGLELDHGKQAVMLVLADHAHDDGTKSFPGTDYIAWKISYSRRQVQRFLDELEASGLISVAAYGSGGRGLATEYTLHLEKGVTKSPYIKNKRVTSATQKGDILAEKGDISDIKGDTAMSPQPLTIIEPSSEPPFVAVDDDVVDESVHDLSYEPDESVIPTRGLRRDKKDKPAIHPDLKKMEEALRRLVGDFSDFAAQRKAINWLLKRYSLDDCVKCLTAVVAEATGPKKWRNGRVSWLTVENYIATWKAKQNGNGRQGQTNAAGNNGTPKRRIEFKSKIRV